MTNSKHLAGLIGPAIVVMSLSETVNLKIWAANSLTNVYLNGALLFIAGLSIVRAHNCWVFDWPVVVTIVGWLAIALGLFRMFVPGLQLQTVKNVNSVLLMAGLTFLTGLFLTFKAYKSS